jgi:Predicted membrane protein
MTEQSNLPTRRVNISTQKMLGGIGSILILLSWMRGVGILLGIVGVVLWLISIYQLSNILGKASIFQKVLIGFVLNIGSMVIAFVFGLMTGVSLFASVRGETGAILGLGLGVFVAIIVAYAISLAAFYFYKEAYDLLAQATAHNLFKIGGLLLFIGAITIILFGLGLLLIIVGYIVLAVAFFTAPNEVEVQSA